MNNVIKIQWKDCMVRIEIIKFKSPSNYLDFTSSQNFVINTTVTSCWPRFNSSNLDSFFLFGDIPSSKNQVCEHVFRTEAEAKSFIHKFKRCIREWRETIE